MAGKEKIMQTKTKVIKPLTDKEKGMDIFDREPCFDAFHLRNNEVCLDCHRPTPCFPHWDGKYESLKKEIAAKDSLIREARVLVYELEGGNTHPVDYSEDRHVFPPLKSFKDSLTKAGLGLPEWESDRPGWKRKALSHQPKNGDGG